MTVSRPPVVFGPRGRRIARLAASPNGECLAFQHVPQNYSTDDHHWLCFCRSGDTFEAVGEMPVTRPPLDVAPLDDGACVRLEEDHGSVVVARWVPSSAGMVESARWSLGSTLAFVDATLRLLPSGREALVVVVDRDDKQVDWGGGPPPDYIQTWLALDVATGEVRQRQSAAQLSEPPIAARLYRASRGVSVLVALGAPSFAGTRGRRECSVLQEIVGGLTEGREYAVHAGCERLLTNRRVIAIASGGTVLELADDPGADRFEPQARFHDLSPDGNYALGTVAGGHFALWNVSRRSTWQPYLPPHGGVHAAVFLPGGRAALGTKLGGVVVVDCREALAPGDTPW